MNDYVNFDWIYMTSVFVVVSNSNWSVYFHELISIDGDTDFIGNTFHAGHVFLHTFRKFITRKI